MKYYIMAALLMTGAGCMSNSDHREDMKSHHGHGTRGRNQSILKSPSAIETEHEHLRHQLEAALSSGGKTAERAREVADVLLPHFEHEEAFATPPLGLLEPLAQGKSLSDAQVLEATGMAERLRADYNKMLKEHEGLTQSLRRLAAAAEAENKPDAVAFAEGLILHAQNEEQVLYPATLVIGDYLNLIQKRGR